MTSLEARLHAANTIMSTAAAMALDLFRQRGSFALEEKGESEFVTQADRRVEQFIRQRLEALLPTDAVMGEEMGGDSASAFWSIDPIDGTANFLRGSPLWGVSLGYVDNGESTVGVICYPALGLTLAAASGLGLSYQGQPYVRTVPFSGVRVVGVGDSPHWPTQDVLAVHALLRDSGWAVSAYRCATIGLGFAALGYTDGYIENRLSIWDLAAGAVICAEAGLALRQGGALTASSHWICAALPAVHELVAPQLANWSASIPSNKPSSN